jgi:hypothetical protein
LISFFIDLEALGCFRFMPLFWFKQFLIQRLDGLFFKVEEFPGETAESWVGLEELCKLGMLFYLHLHV